MARLICCHGSFAFADTVPLLSDLEFVLAPGFTGLVGENGSGKTTLLRLIAGELRLDSGQMRREPSSLRALICTQRVDQVPDNARSLARTHDGRAQELRGRLALSTANLNRWSTLSPGERKRWQIAGALFEAPELLLLDEPSNHLDATGLAWLDGALRLFDGIGVLVTHDRALLDRHTQSTLRLHQGSAQFYALPYSAAQRAWQAEDASRRSHVAELRAAERSLARRVHDAREANQRRAAHSSTRRRMKSSQDHDAQTINRKNIAEWGAKRGERAKSALETRLEQVRARERPKVQHEHGRALELALPPTRRAQVATLDEAEIRAGERVLLRDVRFTLQRSERVAIRGANGAGKSTLLASLVRALEVPPERAFYLPQDLSELEAVQCVERVRALPRDERGRVCEWLSALGARPEAVLASGCPSPGEARKLLLAFGLRRELEALLLDEPTNHLDLPAIERLEAALLRYPGALVVVSHDQRFLERTTDRTLQIDAQRLVWG